MAASLAEKTCVPCRGGIPPLSADEAETFRQQAPGAAVALRTEKMSGLHENDFIRRQSWTARADCRHNRSKA
jgi:hypothetical protein